MRLYSGSSQQFIEDTYQNRIAQKIREAFLHPSVQARQYKMYLEDVHTAFYEEPDAIALSACAYLHNYSPHPDDPLLSSKFQQIVESTPLFTADDAPKFERYLISRLEDGE